jgi:hypothetical protein
LEHSLRKSIKKGAVEFSTAPLKGIKTVGIWGARVLLMITLMDYKRLREHPLIWF